MVALEDLSETERRVWDAFPSGTLVDLGTDDEANNDPAGGDSWGPGRQVRADVLLALLCGAVELPPGQVGAVWLKGARIMGDVRLPGGEFRHALRLERCRLYDIDLTEANTRTLSLEGCHVGLLTLIRTKIRGIFVLSNAHLIAGSDFAQMADGEFAVRLAFADGDIALNRVALYADRLDVTSDVFCNSVHAIGEIRLAGARIGGGLAFGSADLDGKDGPALNAAGLNVSGDMWCDKGFKAAGEINLLGASIGGQLSFRGAHLTCRPSPHESPASDPAPAEDRYGLVGQGLNVAQDLFCDGGFRSDCAISLVDATIGRLRDEKKAWPQRLELKGLTYRDMTPLRASDRTKWLKLSTRYHPQPYEQLAAYYRGLGDDDQARRVLLAKQRRRRQQRKRWARAWGWIQDGLAGYGYAPGRAALLLAAMFIAGWLVFRSHHPSPVGPGPDSKFHAALYTLDLMIPFAGLLQAGEWDPHGMALAVATGLRVLGWLLAITVIAAITRSFSRGS